VKMGKKYKKIQLMKHMVTAFAIFLTAGAAAPFAAAQDAERPVLSVADCAKCHDAAPQAIESAGGKHKTSVTCIDCHQGHPPNNTDIIPQCSMCHTGEKHFELEGCLKCHKNPHTPLNITLADNLTDPCLTCHTDQIDQLKQNPSKHTEQFCTTCHTAHGELPNCTNCHSPHADDMVQSDCLTCHKAHMPLQVVYPDDTPSKLCGSCHQKAFDLLMASPAKHKDVACVDCHKSQHKMVPKCQDCHGIPHPDDMMKKFPTCGDCHGIAHDVTK